MKFTVVDLITPLGSINADLMNYVMMKQEFKKCSVFRFYTLVMYGESLDGLIPLPYVMDILRKETFEGDSNSRDFDIAYANQLMTNPRSHMDLMKLVGSFQFCEETFLLSEYERNSVVNSLIKFITERYSINTFLVKDVIDLDELSVSNFNSEEGYTNLINDLDMFNMKYLTEDQLKNSYVE